MTMTTMYRRIKLLGLLALHGCVLSLAVGTILAELGETWWLADLFAHFRYHYVLAALILALAAVALGRRGAALAAACLVLPQLWAIAAPPRTPTSEVNAAGTPLRVMSMNVLVINRRYADVVATVEQQHPDVLSLQEISPDWHPVIERLAERLPHVAPADWRTQPSGNILLSRYPIPESHMVVPPNQYPAFAHVEATVLLNGRPIRVLAVHPPVPFGPYFTGVQQAHLDYYANLSVSTETPLLIVGDFNLTPYSPRFRALLRDGGLSYVHLGWYWPRSWPSENGWRIQRYVRGFQIDHVLTSRHFRAAGARSLGDVGSDHYPVVADLILRR